MVVRKDNLVATQNEIISIDRRKYDYIYLQKWC